MTVIKVVRKREKSHRQQPQSLTTTGNCHQSWPSISLLLCMTHQNHHHHHWQAWQQPREDRNDDGKRWCWWWWDGWMEKCSKNISHQKKYTHITQAPSSTTRREETSSRSCRSSTTPVPNNTSVMTKCQGKFIVLHHQPTHLKETNITNDESSEDIIRFPVSYRRYESDDRTSREKRWCLRQQMILSLPLFFPSPVISTSMSTTIGSDIRKVMSENSSFTTTRVRTCRCVTSTDTRVSVWLCTSLPSQHLGDEDDDDRKDADCEWQQEWVENPLS